MGFSRQEYWSGEPLPSPQVVLEVKNLPVNAKDIRRARSMPGSGRSLGERDGNLLQYSCLGKPMDIGDWWATVPRVAKV